MHLDRLDLEVVALAAIAVAVLAVVLAVVATARAGRLRRQLSALRADPAVVTGVDPKAVRHVAVLRYDAFEDTGGQLSYSVALLDVAGDGVVLSAINGRSDSRTYAKGILGGQGEQPLSPEERQAVESALGARAATRPRRASRAGRQAWRGA